MIILLCAMGAALLAWFNAFNLTLFFGILVSIFSKSRYELILKIKDAQGQAPLMLGLIGIPLGTLSLFLLKAVYNKTRKQNSPWIKWLWIITLIACIYIPVSYFAKNISIFDNQNPPNVLVWDEEAKINRVVPRGNVVNNTDPNKKFVWDAKIRAYRVVQSEASK